MKSSTHTTTNGYGTTTVDFVNATVTYAGRHDGLVVVVDRRNRGVTMTCNGQPMTVGYDVWANYLRWAAKDASTARRATA